MSVRVTVEGGGSFELDDHHLRMVKDSNWSAKSLIGLVRDALPPEPYQPKEGDRVEYCFPHWQHGWDGVYVYLGTWRDWHIISPADRGEIVPRFLAGGADFRRVES